MSDTNEPKTDTTEQAGVPDPKDFADAMRAALEDGAKRAAEMIKTVDDDALQFLFEVSAAQISVVAAEMGARHGIPDAHVTVLVHPKQQPQANPWPLSPSDNGLPN